MWGFFKIEGVKKHAPCLAKTDLGKYFEEAVDAIIAKDNKKAAEALEKANKVIEPSLAKCKVGKTEHDAVFTKINKSMEILADEKHAIAVMTTNYLFHRTATN